MSSGLQRQDRLGRGWGQPIAPGATPSITSSVGTGSAGRLPVVEGPEKVRQAIYTILDTDPGERVMRPDFGCGLRRWLMQPNNPATRSGIQRDIEAALARWEPRIRVQDLHVRATDERSTVLIELHYAHVLDQRQDVLVFPFYLEPAR